MKRELHAIRGIDEETYMKFREKVFAERMKMGKAMTEAMTTWMTKKDTREAKPNPRNFLKLEGFIKTKKKVRWSEEIDEVLYGWKK